MVMFESGRSSQGRIKDLRGPGGLEMFGWPSTKDAGREWG